MISDNLVQKIQPVRLFLMDVDGTLSDGRLHYNAEWIESKAFDVRDGFGIWLLHYLGIKTGIVTGRLSRIVEERARELEIPFVFQGRFSKDGVLDEIQNQHDFGDEEVAFIGDDLFDLPLLTRVGFSAAPADAHPEVRKRVDFVSQWNGGRGAVREVCELIIKAKGQWKSVLQMFL
jgi:3-deoxy-D-manno-octulosonate 8-phosphate phosphatase (KDO 8-P phosphatase)